MQVFYSYIKGILSAVAIMAFTISCSGDSLPISGTPPYQAEKFQAAIDNASWVQYQLYLNTTDYVQGTVKGEEVQTFANEYYFYLSDNNQMVFRNYRPADSEASRMELRSSKAGCFDSSTINCEFSISESNTMAGTLALSDSTTNEYTWMQLHRIKENLNSVAPPLRLVWINSARGYEDYLWAVFYKTNPDPSEGYEGNYKYIPIMPRANQYIQASISTADNVVIVNINGNTVANEDYSNEAAQWDYCADDGCLYFKAGIYMSGGRTSGNAEGIATVAFDQLSIDLAP